MKIVKQLGLKDCGSACILSVLQHYGGYVPMERIKEDTYTTIEGTTAFHILEALKQYGFDAEGVKLSHNEFFYKNQILPAIAHIVEDNGYEHFVVVYKKSKTSVTIMDPAKGKVILSKKEWEKKWTEVLLIVHPKGILAQYEKPQKITFLFEMFIMEYKKEFLLIIGVTLLLFIAQSLMQYHYQIGMNLQERVIDSKVLLFFKFFFCIIYLYTVLFIFLKEQLKLYLLKKIQLKTLYNFVKKIIFLPYQKLLSKSNGEYITRIYESFEYVNLLLVFFLELPFQLAIVILLLIFISLLQKSIFLILLIGIFLYTFVSIVNHFLLKRRLNQLISSQANFNEALLDKFQNMISIKHLVKNKEALRDLEIKMVDFVASWSKAQKLTSKINKIMLLIEHMIQYFVILNCLKLFKDGHVLLYEVVTYQFFYQFILSILEQIIEILSKSSYLQLLHLKYQEIMSLDSEPQNSVKESFQNGDIQIKNMNYSYDGYKNIINTLNMNITKNEFHLFYGSSGSGKSTLCKLIVRDLDVTKGKIVIGKQNILDYHFNTIKENIIYASQDESLIHGTIKENILFYEDLDQERFQLVSEICDLESIIAQKPLRYETMIYTNLKFLSGGEAQRIKLARALYKEASIYIFDEALSEVDEKTEEQILMNMKSKLIDKTVIYVSHKPLHKYFDKIHLFESRVA